MKMPRDDKVETLTFEELPEWMQAEILAKRQRENDADTAWYGRVRHRAVVTGIMGALGQLVMLPFLGRIGLVYAVLAMVIAVASAVWATVQEDSALGFALRFGGATVGLSLVGHVVGLIELGGGGMPFFLFAWLALVLMGQFMGAWCENRRLERVPY